MSTIEAGLDGCEKQIADQFWKKDGFDTCAAWLASYAYPGWGRCVLGPEVRAMMVYQLLDDGVPLYGEGGITDLVWGIGPDKLKSLVMEKADGVPARQADMGRYPRKNKLDRETVKAAQDRGEDYIAQAHQLGYEVVPYQYKGQPRWVLRPHGDES